MSESMTMHLALAQALLDASPETFLNGKPPEPDHLKRAKELTAYWQERLCLQDWEVVVKIKYWHALGREKQAEVCWEIRKKMAIISLLNPDHAIEFDFHCSMEQSVIHELLHLHMATVFIPDEGTPEDIAQEQVIHFLSKALLKGREQAL